MLHHGIDNARIHYETGAYPGGYRDGLDAAVRKSVWEGVMGGQCYDFNVWWPLADGLGPELATSNVVPRELLTVKSVQLMALHSQRSAANGANGELVNGAQHASEHGEATENGGPKHSPPHAIHRFRCGRSVLALVVSDDKIFAATQGGDITVRRPVLHLQRH